MVLFVIPRCYNYLENAVGLCRLAVMEGEFLIMEVHYRKVIYYYFKNLFQNTILKAVLFTVGFVLACVFEGFHAINLILLLCGAAAIAIDYNLFRLYFKARRELKHGKVVSKNIFVKRLYQDRRHNYYKRDGSVKGNDKYILTDSYNRQYLFCVRKNNEMSVFDEDGEFSNVKMKISYLPESKLILVMDCDLFGESMSENLSQYVAE